MSNKISINLPTHLTLDEIISQVRKHVNTLDGDTSSGTFIVENVKGNYTINDYKIDIEITDKPFFVPMSLVTTKIKVAFQYIK